MPRVCQNFIKSQAPTSLKNRKQIEFNFDFLSTFHIVISTMNFEMELTDEELAAVSAGEAIFLQLVLV